VKEMKLKLAKFISSFSQRKFLVPLRISEPFVQVTRERAFTI